MPVLCWLQPLGLHSRAGRCCCLKSSSTTWRVYWTAYAVMAFSEFLYTWWGKLQLIYLTRNPWEIFVQKQKKVFIYCRQQKSRETPFLLTSFILYLNPIFQKTAVFSNRNLSLHLTLPEMHVLVLLMSPYFECPLEKEERVISIHSYHILWHVTTSRWKLNDLICSLYGHIA